MVSSERHHLLRLDYVHIKSVIVFLRDRKIKITVKYHKRFRGGLGMKKSIWRQCTSKKRYGDEHKSNHYRKMFERQRGKKLDYYWCVYCKGYHLTSREGNLEDYFVAE